MQKMHHTKERADCFKKTRQCVTCALRERRRLLSMTYFELPDSWSAQSAPSEREEISLGDCIEMIGKKR